MLALFGMNDIILVTKAHRLLDLSDAFFVAFNNFLQGVMYFSLKSLPLMVLAANISPVNLEATFFALFSSVTNISFVVSALFGSFLAYVFQISADNYASLWILMLIRCSS